MTLEIGLLFALLAAMVYLFLTEKLPVDLTAFLGLVVMIFLFGRHLSAQEAFSGFASSAVITMLAIFIVSASLQHTGLADLIGQKVHALLGAREVPLVVVIMAVTAVMSAFMNNIAAAAVLMPAVAGIARRAGLSPSRLFMPLSFGAILGGSLTSVGTPPNILAVALLEERGQTPFGLFEFAPVGAALILAGIVYMITVGRRLLPDTQHGPALAETGDLGQVYQLEEQLFSIRLPKGSPLDGRTLGEARLGTALGVQVVAILRNGRKRLAPEATSTLHAGDVLLVRGRLEDLRELSRVRGVEVEQAGAEALPRPARGVGGVRARLAPGSPLTGRSLRELRFRARFGLVVIALVRGDETLLEDLAQETLEPGDEILAVGPRPALEALGQGPDFEVLEVGLGAVSHLSDRIYFIRIPDGSPLAGSTVRGSRLGELVGLTVAGILRHDVTHLGVSPDEPLQAGDRLLMVGEPSRINTLLEVGDLELDAETPAEAELESEEVGLVEAAVAPRSAAAGQTLAELEFRDRYGLQVLALWRRGQPLHANLAQLALRFGDALLLQGPWEKIDRLSREADFVVLTPSALEPRRTSKMPFALGGLMLMIALVVSGYQPIHVAAFTAASLVILAGAVTMKEAYRAIEWKAIFLVAAVLPVGMVMERTGAAALLAGSVTELAGPLGPYAVLASLVVLSSLLSQGLDGAPAVVLLTPVALDAAASLGISPRPIMMGVALAASAAFMTPFSHKANLLVMGAGGYRAMDYVRVGTPLTVVVFAILVLLVPVFFPFYP